MIILLLYIYNIQIIAVYIYSYDFYIIYIIYHSMIVVVVFTYLNAGTAVEDYDTNSCQVV